MLVSKHCPVKRKIDLLLWVNLLPHGARDARMVHAGLPIADGVKYGMNIWPRTFFGPDA